RDSKKKGEIVTVIPHGATAEIDTDLTKEEKLDSHWSKKTNGNYKKVIYSTSDGLSYQDIYISTSKAYVKEFSDGKFKVICKTDKSTDGIAGALERINADSDSEILRVIPLGTELEIEPDKDNIWAKVKY